MGKAVVNAKAKIAPSILSADFANLGKEIGELGDWGASMVHCDVMDGVFVPVISFGAQLVKAVRPYTKLPLDVHLMITQPERHVEQFAKAGADMITVHQEATVHLHRTLHLIRECGIKAGIALNPATPVTAIENILDMVDLVLIMTVNPGYGGQPFIPAMFAKIAAAKELITSSGLPVEIQVDGGVTHDNAKRLISTGAGILVAGTAVFKADDPQEAIRRLIG